MIETDELRELLRSGPGGPDDDLKLINGTWYMPGSKDVNEEGDEVLKDAWKEHLYQRITKDTVFFDHDLVCDRTSTLSHTMPRLTEFISHMKAMKI